MLTLNFSFTIKRMHSFENLLSKNLPVCVRVQETDFMEASWGQQVAFFLLITSTCISGMTVLTDITFKMGWHNLQPFNLEISWLLLGLIALLFLASLVSLAFWIYDDNSQIKFSHKHKNEDLDFIYPQSHSLHIEDKAWDLTDAYKIILDYPDKVLVYYKDPDRMFILQDDRSGYPFDHLSPQKEKELRYNSALFVYLTGVDLPNRAIYQTNWWWNIFAGLMFVVATIIPFFFQAVGMPFYWIGFFAIPVSYIAFRVGQKEFQNYRFFSYAQFLIDHQTKIDPRLYRTPLI